MQVHLQDLHFDGINESKVPTGPWLQTTSSWWNLKLPYLPLESLWKKICTQQKGGAEYNIWTNSSGVDGKKNTSWMPPSHTPAQPQGEWNSHHQGRHAAKEWVASMTSGWNKSRGWWSSSSCQSASRGAEIDTKRGLFIQTLNRWAANPEACAPPWKQIIGCQYPRHSYIRHVGLFFVLFWPYSFFFILVSTLCTLETMYD